MNERSPVPSLLMPPEGWAEADFVQAVLARLPWHHQEALPEATIRKFRRVQTSCLHAMLFALVSVGRRQHKLAMVC